MPDCALHLSKALDSSRAVALAIRNFGRDGDEPFPAIAIRLTNCMRRYDSTISPRRLGLEVMREMIRLRRIIAGEDPNESFGKEFLALGFDEVKSTYRRGTPFESVIAAADAHFGPVMGRFRPALADPFSGTMKGDARMFLESRRTAA